MKQIKIKITVPDNTNAWKISIGKGRPRVKKNAVAVFRHAERYLTRKFMTSSASEVNMKIKVLVDHSAIHHLKPMAWNSEGICAGKNDTLYWLASNLEDYLPNRYLSMKCRIYKEGFSERGGENI